MQCGCSDIGYLSPLCKKQYSIDDTQRFLNLLSSLPHLQDGKYDIAYDPQPLFVSILIEETINYILQQI